MQLNSKEGRRSTQFLGSTEIQEAQDFAAVKATADSVEKKAKEAKKLAVDVKKKKKALDDANQILQKSIAADMKRELAKEAADKKAAKAAEKKAFAVVKKKEMEQEALVKKVSKMGIKPKRAAPTRKKAVKALEVEKEEVDRVAETIVQVNSRGRIIRPNSRYI